MALCLCAIEGSHIEVWLDEGLYLVARGVLPKLKCKISLLVRLLIFASANVQWRSVGVGGPVRGYGISRGLGDTKGAIELGIARV